MSDDYLKQWLLSTSQHLDEISAEELEQGYLAVQDGCRPTIEEFLNSDADQ